MIQVQGRALLPGAAMIEMASSACELLLARTGAGVPLPVSVGIQTLVGVSIPAPLLLASSGDAALSVGVDGRSGRCSVQSLTAGTAARTTHVVCSSAWAMQRFATGSPPANNDMSKRTPAAAALMADAAQPQRHPGTAVAQLCQTWAGQSEQYRVHPAVLDNCTQV